MELTAVRLLPVTLHLKRSFSSAYETVQTRVVTWVPVVDELGY